MKQFELKRVKDLLSIDLTNLIIESEKEGFLFIERLINDYKNGNNTFSKPGEFLYGVSNQEGSIIIAIGGINKDRFSTNERIGRLRIF
ncbi:hypothetical protein [Bacillus sp. CBEL-1]|uniref:hypothetical protein n=1 Tax=Bacillus sp. CBEL-1 TaxID=2502980 RepID=UPI00104D51EB|nr:hypothetical protein [Bacillus sp. CBEL-1]TDB49541.1 hypothetical protein EPL02_10500 [Bacillus sp. CBEL-1]